MASMFSDPLTATCIFILVLETVFGISSSLFILGIIMKESKKKKRMKMGNKIRIAVTASNALYSISLFVGAVSGFLGPRNVQITHSTSAYIFYSLNMFAMTSSSWLTTVISFFYSIKIVDFKAGAIVWVKKNLGTVIPWMILGVEALALFTCLLNMLLFINPQTSSVNNSTAMSLNNSKLITSTIVLSIIIIVSCPPFLVILVNSSCIAGTLMKHRQSIANNMGTSAKDKANIFGNKVYHMVFVSLSYAFYYTFVLLYFLATIGQLRVEFWVFLLPIASYSPLQSVHQFIANPGLKEKAKEMLKCAVCK